MRTTPILLMALAGCTAGTDTNEPDPLDDIGVNALFEGEMQLPTTAALRFTLDGVDADDVRVELSPAVDVDLVWDEVDEVLSAWPVPGLDVVQAYDVTVTTRLGTAVIPVHTDNEVPAPNGSDALCEDGECVRVVMEGRSTRERTYRMTTEHPLRDNNPASGEVFFFESPEQPILRSGHDLFDALFAMSIHETRQLSVDQIQDGAFNSGNPIACDCFQTGELWRYVWTRDTAYAVDLGLAWLDPARSRNSLDFKLSRPRDGGPLQIVQDTGTGGSWPVSTDRVVWAIGAAKVLDFLEEPARSVFAERAREAMATTAEMDRVTVYSAERGLYTGEQSFLDWREQSYPLWVRGDVVHVGTSEALSTNVGHLALLDLLTELSVEVGEGDDAARYGAWADDLRASIDQNLWEGDGYATMTTGPLDRAPVGRWDLLGTALASEHVGDADKGRTAIASYPHADHGPPVQWPQLPDVRVYHNRAIWPFVTAYGLREARRHDLAEHVTHDVLGLVRSSALNLSNMENYEFLSGDNWWDDGDLSGPVVNSRRQLWSVAGYLSAVVDTLYGLQSTPDDIAFEPFIPGGVRDTLFANTDRVVLSAFPYKGHLLDIELRLPLAGTGHSAAASIHSITLNGAALPDGRITPEALSDGTNHVVITLVARDAATEPVVLVDSSTPGNALFGPPEPVISGISGANTARTVSWTGPSGAEFAVYRDGERLAEGLTTGTYTDTDDTGVTSPCYAIEASWPESGLRSHHSKAFCDWGPSSEQRVQVIDGSAFTATGGSYTERNGRAYYSGWGADDHTLRIPVTASRTGPHLLSFTYANGAAGFDSGVTAGVKWVSIEGQPGEHMVMFPHTASWDTWLESSFAQVDLTAGETVTVVVSDGPNMSDLTHFALYAGMGGTEAFNDIDIAELKVLSR